MRFYRSLIILVTLTFLISLSIYSQTATVISENANLRGTAKQSGKVVEILPNGFSVQVIKQQGSWFLVQTPDFVGWLHGNTIKLAGNDISEESVSDSDYTAPVSSKSARTKKRLLSNKSRSSSRRSSNTRNYYLGPRGGCYYINGNGNKTYVDHSLCR